jgi:hypothetical protein
MTRRASYVEWLRFIAQAAVLEARGSIVDAHHLLDAAAAMRRELEAKSSDDREHARAR